MKRLTMTLALIALVATAPAQAGEGKCKEDAQTCLTKMTEHLKNRGWVGIEMDENEETGLMVIQRVIPDSPAQAAGFQVGDMMLAFNGIRYAEENKEALKASYGEMVPGNKVTYTVKRDGNKVELKVHLAELPETVMAQWIGQHMLEYHTGQAEEEEQIAATP